MLGIQVYYYEHNITLMRLCSFGTQIRSHLATLKHKKKAQVICLTSIYADTISESVPLSAEAIQGEGKAVGSCLGRFSTAQENIKWIVFLFSASVIFIFPIFSHFLSVSTLQPHHPFLSVSLPTWHCTSKAAATAISSFGGLHAACEKFQAPKVWKKETNILH